MSDNTKPCPVCEGSGIRINGDGKNAYYANCPVCKGEGRVPVEPEGVVGSLYGIKAAHVSNVGDTREHIEPYTDCWCYEPSQLDTDKSFKAIVTAVFDEFRAAGLSGLYGVQDVLVQAHISNMVAELEGLEKRTSQGLVELRHDVDEGETRLGVELSMKIFRYEFHALITRLKGGQ